MEQPARGGLTMEIPTYEEGEKALAQARHSIEMITQQLKGGVTLREWDEVNSQLEETRGLLLDVLYGIGQTDRRYARELYEKETERIEAIFHKLTISLN